MYSISVPFSNQQKRAGKCPGQDLRKHITYLLNVRCWLIQNVLPIRLKTSSSWSQKEDMRLSGVEWGMRPWCGHTASLAHWVYCLQYLFICLFPKPPLHFRWVAQAWAGEGHICLTATKHFQNFVCRNSDFIISRMLLGWPGRAFWWQMHIRSA